MTPDQARTALQEAISHVVPGADLTGLAPDADVRDALELDSLDFVEVVEQLSGIVGFRIEDHEADALRTIDSAARFLTARAPAR
jgi:acyl carrier protein